MTKILLAVVSCHSRPEFSDAIRNTWYSKVQGADIRFFLGRGPNSPKDDEVLLDCDDTYRGLPEKVQSIFRWATEHGYDYVSKIDDDVIMDPIRFLSLVGKHDFMGMGKSPDCTEEIFQMPYGFCYTLSRRAMEVIIDTPLPNNGNDEYWVSWSLRNKNIYEHCEWSCRLWEGTPSMYPELPDTTVFCVHLHHKMTRPEEVHEMCRIWRDNFNG